MKQVLIRKPMLHGNVAQMVRADVISEQGDMLTVKFPQEMHTRQVPAKDTLAVAQYFANQVGTNREALLMKCYPQGQKSLFSRLNSNQPIS